MLTKVTVYSQWTPVAPLVLNVINRPETDLFEVRNIDGLGSVKADINTVPLASVDGESFVGSGVGKRNIVLTLGMTPDWTTWTVSKLRRLLDKYFIPKQTVRLVFETVDFSPVEIFGYIESNEPNMFSKDPEQQISIICPSLYFKSVDQTIITGSTADAPIAIDYEGDVETGFVVAVSRAASGGVTPSWVKIQVHDPLTNYIQVTKTGLVDVNVNYHMSSVPGDKYVRQLNAGGNLLANLLNLRVISDSNDREDRWPKLGPGTLDFAVTSQAAIQNWELSYYNLFGSL